MALAVTGIAVQAFELVDASALLDWARGLAAHWWLAVALVLLQVVLSTFALPGSAVLWLVAPLNAPIAAAAILKAGGCIGALGAYAFASRLTWTAMARLQTSRGDRLMQREGGFLLQCALRLAPCARVSVLGAQLRRGRVAAAAGAIPGLDGDWLPSRPGCTAEPSTRHWLPVA